MSKAYKKKRRLVIRTIVLVLLASAIIYSIASKENVKVLVVGDKAPDFELVDLEGNKHRLSDYKGQGVFLNFWGTWCPPCKEEMPYMERQYQTFKDKGVEILAVDIAEPALKVETFRDQYGLTFPIMIDKNKSVMEVYNIGPLPTTVLIDEEGTIVHVEKRGMSEEVIKSFMERIQPK